MVLSTIAAAALLQMSAAVPSLDPRPQRDARAAQARFEMIRRAHLPWNRSGGSTRDCDAIIGRYCYWYDSAEAVVVPEPQRIIAARNQLINFLDSAAARDPSDAWVAGQRVRYLIEAGRPAAAADAARACRADRALCAALEGLSLHVAEQYPGADSVFAIALREMPADIRCEWLDVSHFVADRLRREMSRAGCEERGELANRVWTLSQPLWTTSGNDLRTEHFARLTMALILARSANAHGMSWGSDSRELLLRYGWAEWFTREDALPGPYASPRVMGHDREPSYYFFPEIPSVRGMARITSASWRLRDPTARTRYAPRHLEQLSALPHQLARFPRGDSMLVAVSYSVGDTALARDSLAAVLALFDGSKIAVIDGHASGIVFTTVPRDTVIASVEVCGERTRRAARARYTIDPLPCDRWCVSDLLLFTPVSPSIADDVEHVLRVAATELKFATRDPLGVFWESEGTGAAPVWLTLTLAPVRVSLARRVATRLHLAPESTPVRLRWQSSHATRQARHVILHLPPSARGKYRVVLTVEPPDAAPITVSRQIELVR